MLQDIKNWLAWTQLLLLGPLSLVLVFAMSPVAYAQQMGGPYTQGPPATVPMMCGPSGCDNNAMTLMTTANVSSPCSTGGSVFGNQYRFRVICGSTLATGVTVTFPVPRTISSTCVVTGETVPVNVMSYTGSTLTGVSWTFASTASTAWSVICMGI